MWTVASIAPLSMKKPKLTKKNANKLATYTQGDNPGAHSYTPANTLPGDAATRKETHNSKSKSPPAHKVVLASVITPPAHMVALAQGYTPPGSHSHTARVGQGHPPGSLTRPTHSPCGPYPPN